MAASTDPLADTEDVEIALLRPLTPTERVYVPGLIAQASALLRLASPSIDNRIGQFNIDPADLSAVSPDAVSAVLAGVVKRYMVNPTGLASTTRSAGPYSESLTYALRSEKETRGALQITDADLAVLFPSRKRARVGTIRTRPALAGRPVGRYGPPPTYDEAISSVVMFNEDGTVFLGEQGLVVISGNVSA